MRVLRFARRYGVFAIAIAVVATTGVGAVAKSKGKVARLAEPAAIAKTVSANLTVTAPQFFTINQVLQQRTEPLTPKRPIQLASLDPAALRGSFSETPPPSPVPADEPFGLLAFRAPEGLLWTKWRAVQSEIERDVAILSACKAEPEQCPSDAARRFLLVVEAVGSRTGRARLEEANRLVNASIRYMSDLAQHGIADLWSAPLATFSSGRGDCEDYAIAKYVSLRQAGMPAEDLRIVLGRDLAVREAHAVLAVRHAGQWFVLDNRRSYAVEEDEVRNLVPLYALDGSGVKLFAAPYADRGQNQIDLAPAEAPSILMEPR